MTVELSHEYKALSSIIIMYDVRYKFKHNLENENREFLYLLNTIWQSCNGDILIQKIIINIRFSWKDIFCITNNVSPPR